MEQTAFELSRGLWREIRPRLGARTVVGIAARWRLPAKAQTQPAVVHDLSFTGARLLVPADDAIVLDATVELAVEGTWTSTRVVWLEESAHPSARWCGVSFVRPGPDFAIAVATATGRRPGEPCSPLSWEQGGSGDLSA